MEKAQARRQRVVVGIVIALALAGVILAIVDWRQIRSIIGQSDWRYILIALACALVSYSCISYAFVVVNRLFHVGMEKRDLFEIGLVSILLNHILTAGGAPGYSIRVLLMGQHGVRTRIILATSLFHIYVNSLGMMALLPIGLAYLGFRHPLSRQLSLLVIAAAAVLLAVFALATALVFLAPLRRFVLRLVGRVATRVMRRDLIGTLVDFDATMSLGIHEVLADPISIPFLFALTGLDWAASAACLWLCFRALGVALQLGELLTGFTLGMTAGLVSAVPGGLGVQEGSMAGIYALLGVNLRRAALGAILYRVVYYLIPYGLSLLFYHRLIRVSRDAANARAAAQAQDGGSESAEGKP